SSSTYLFLKEQEILPLPCARTMTNFTQPIAVFTNGPVKGDIFGTTSYQSNLFTGKVWSHIVNGVVSDGATTNCKLCSSMAKGIEYYRCHAKIKALENHVLNHSIPEDEFLIKTTIESLQVTIKSVINLSKHLLEECEFKYVLTSKMNQDPLEQFFGMSRQATGPNNHPNCRNILTPPKSGNCTILDYTQPKLSMKDIKEVFSKNDTSESQLKVDCLKKRLDALVAQEIEVDHVLEVNNFNDHDYYKSDTESCILYYFCGYVTRHINTLSVAIVKKQY
ncbi:Uncharacterized protein FWK35_00019074, partial [Aphis craccivora]